MATHSSVLAWRIPGTGGQEPPAATALLFLPFPSPRAVRAQSHFLFFLGSELDYISQPSRQLGAATALVLVNGMWAGGMWAISRPGYYNSHLILHTLPWAAEDQVEEARAPGDAGATR